MFTGGAKSASILKADQLIAFDKWFRLSMHKMRMYNLPEEHYAACLIAHLDGPARSSWFAKYPDAKDISAQHFYDDFCTLIPHYKLYCTEAYTGCVFTPSTLVDDIETFLAYVRFSGVMPDFEVYHEVVSDMFFQKLSQSCSHLIEVARNCYGIDMKATLPLSILADNAKAAARRYVVDYPSKKSGAHYRVDIADTSTTTRPLPEISGGQWKTVKGKDKKRKDRTSQAPAEFKASANMTDAELLKKYQRCGTCGYKPPLDTSGNPKHHQCESGKLAARLSAMRMDLEKGKDPNLFPTPRKTPKTSTGK